MVECNNCGKEIIFHNGVWWHPHNDSPYCRLEQMAEPKK